MKKFDKKANKTFQFDFDFTSVLFKPKGVLQINQKYLETDLNSCSSFINNLAPTFVRDWNFNFECFLAPVFYWIWNIKKIQYEYLLFFFLLLNSFIKKFFRIDWFIGRIMRIFRTDSMINFTDYFHDYL